MTKKKQETTCADPNCPHHASLKTHGRIFTGTVVEAKAQKTATVSWERRKYLAKYERHEKLKTVVKAHNPECLNAKKGDIVRIQECRPLSKTKHFVIVEKTGTDIQFLAREELLEQAKAPAQPTVEEQP